MKIAKQALQLAAASILLVASCVYAQETQKLVFEKYGFTMEVPKDLGLHCDESKIETFAEALSKQIISGPRVSDTVCTSPYRKDIVLKLGWRAKNFPNSEFSVRTISEFVGLNIGAGKPFEYVCDNNTGVDEKLVANKYPVGEKFDTRTFSCDVSATDTSYLPPQQSKFTIYFFIFYSGKNTDTVNWITVSDYVKPGSATADYVLNITRTIRRTSN